MFFFCSPPNCLDNSKSKVSTYKFPANSKLRKQWVLKMKEKNLSQTRTLALFCAVHHLFEDCFRENLAIRRFLHLKEDAVPTIFFVRKRNHREH